jgi:hypothetical protein
MVYVENVVKGVQKQDIWWIKYHCK